MLLTDTEEFKKEDTEVLEGIYHLTKDGTTPYCHLSKVDLNESSEEKQITDEAYQEFTFQACRAFQILRERAYVFINLLQLMLVSDIEELKQKDIKYLIGAMFLDMNEEQAQSEFTKKIKIALDERYRKYDNLAHVYMDWRKG